MANRLSPGTYVMMSRQARRMRRKGREARYRLNRGLLKRALAMNRLSPTGGVE
jgi:hypothetical protein